MKRKIVTLICIALVLISTIIIMINLEHIKNYFEGSKQNVDEVIETPKNEEVSKNTKITQNGFEDNEYVCYDFVNVCNNSDISLNDFILHDSLPTDAVRINRIYTGIWNDDIKYSIWYKTNTNSEYIMLQDNFSTQINNEVKFLDIQLNDNEFITDFEFRFGTVRSDFAEIVQPRLYCDVLENLEDGYEYTNYIKLSGMFEDEYTESENKCTITRTYKEVNAEIMPR